MTKNLVTRFNLLGRAHLRALAVTSRDRSDHLKRIPTMMESGVADFDISSTLGVMVPAATPKWVIERLSTKIIRVVQLPEVKSRLTVHGYEGDPLGAAEYETYTRAKIEHMRKIVKETKIKVD